MNSTPPAGSPDFVELAELLRQGRAASYPVANVAEGERNWEDFLRAVLGWRESFAARSEARFALFHSDTWTFATALFGGWLARKVLLLPGDAQASTLAAVCAEVDALAGEFPNDTGKPLLAPAQPSSRWVPPTPLDLNWPGLVVMTSGSTGRPTPFTKRLSQFAEELRAQETTFGARLGKARVLATVSHQHIYGLIFRVLWPLTAGRVFETRQLYFPEEIIAQAESSPGALLVTSPAHLKRLPEQLPWHSIRDRVRAVFSSGGPLDFPSAELCRERLQQWPIEVYGSSETGGVAVRERRAERTPWSPLPGVELDVAPDSDVLRVRSPHVWDAAWFQTSDRVRFGEDGSFELVGRADRIVKIEEKRVSLQAIERALAESGLVREARVVVLPGARTELGAVVVPSAEGDALLRSRGKLGLNQALRDAAARSVERIGLPRRFRYVEALPMSTQGKISDESLRALFSEGAE